MSHLSDEEKLRLGVGITELEIIDKKVNNSRIP